MIKRESEETNGGETKKRKVLDELSEEGPLTQEDVVYYQKEAIMRQLQHYKQHVFIVKKEYKLLNTEFEAYKNRLLLLNGWIDQFLTLVGAMAPDSDAATSTINFLLDVPSALESDDFIEKLNSKKLKLTESIRKIAENVPSDISESLATISKELQNVRNKYNSLKADNQNLNNKYNNLSETYQKLFKEHQRFQSKTIPRLIGKKEESTEATENHTDKPKDDTTTDATTSKGIIPTASPDGPVDLDRIHELQSQIEESKAVINAQKITIEQNITRFQTLSTHLVNPSNTPASIESVESSEQYKSLQNQNKELEAKHEEYIQRLELLENDLKESKDQHLASEESLKLFYTEKAALEKELSETKEKEERLRNERDLAVTEGELWKQKNNFKTLTDLQDLVNAQEAQIKSFNFASKLNEVIPSDLSDVESLQKKNGLLLAEIKELETAFKQLQSVRVPKVMSATDEEKRKRDLDAAKIKVDHKYRTLMQGEQYQKASGEKLHATFKVLKTSFEKIESQQSEYKKQIDQLNSEIADLKKLLVTKELETKEYNQRCSKLEESLKAETAQSAKIQQDFNVLKDEYQEVLRKESDEAQELASVKSKLASQDKLIARYKATGSTEDSSEIDSFRSLIYCSLCSKNWKNTAIKTCGHVFCDACAKERLAARMRKCPSCNKQFSTNDLLTIHL